MSLGWTVLLDLIITLAAAALMGVAFERLKQSATIGFILGGVLVGPSALALVREKSVIEGIAELGVVLLMFSIGLEFSWKRLSKLGPTVFKAGGAQVLGTGAAASALALLFQMPLNTAVAVGAIVTLSSTAIVLRVLRDASELDSSYGKNSLGILLVQDIAVVPLVLIVTALGSNKGSSTTSASLPIGITIAFAFLFVVLAFPKILHLATSSRNREIPILLAVIMVATSAWASHTIGLSPSVGAFIAGVVLGGSAFSDQIMADVGPLRTLFLTIFFASIGMLADLAWVASHIVPVLALALTIILGKLILIFGILRLLNQSPITSLATGFCLAHIGEFSFLIGGVAMSGGLLDKDTFQLFTSASVLTLVATPYLVMHAPRLARSLAKRLSRARNLAREERSRGEKPRLDDHLILVGFGDAGKAVAQSLAGHGKLLVLEINGELAQRAKEQGHLSQVGDATQPAILEHVSLESARVLIIAIPDFSTVKLIVRHARSLAPEVPIVARARYHNIAASLAEDGANVVLDEEQLVGSRMAQEALNCSREERIIVPASEG